MIKDMVGGRTLYVATAAVEASAVVTSVGIRIAVLKRGDLGLLNQDLTASGTMLTLGKTGISTSRSNRPVDYFRVTRGRNFRVLNQNFTTRGTMLTFGKSGSSTGRRNSTVNYFRVTRGRNFRLLN